MLTRETIQRMVDRGFSSAPPVAMDRHDNPEHRIGDSGPAIPKNYEPRPGARVIDPRLVYDENGNIVKLGNE
jgi:hypothetical protein